MSEAVLMLAIGTAVLAILFGARLAVRATGGAAAQRPENSGVDAAGGSGAPDVASVIALPPFIFLGFLVAATVLEAHTPCWADTSPSPLPVPSATDTDATSTAQ